MQKSNLQVMLMKILKTKGYNRVINNNMFIIAEGELPVCLIAHIDTVFARPASTFFFDQEKNTLWSPHGLGADDRAGIYAILRLLEDGYRPSIIFTDLEEQGGIGAEALVSHFSACPFKDCKALIQLDRRGVNDSVYYDCANSDFEKKINSYGFDSNWGTFSDISIIAPVWDIAAVNLSVGYQNEHTIAEYLNMGQLENTITKVAKMLKECKEWPVYDYVHAIQAISENDNWWSLDSCICCGKHLKKDEGHLDQGFDSNSRFKICDECYDKYFK